ncbi:elongation factor P--(R)-beta-lysine ligase [Desulfosarcina sp. BuS5]|uniref:EF-P lysine aminoacylase EpmA n=1 Tax=Desulfosarcina sp. BuS5 TaxID=933262 RepID=UPI00054CE02B|nr:elongation factor P--(R)-beta-lysine ligase [Desulfosarcina sp. BuS5]
MPKLKKHLKLRADIIRSARSFFYNKGYLEVETPLRIPAPAPETFIDAVETGDFFLQASPELCMKRLLSSGYKRIFQICRCFRQAERGEKHLPEFTMLEWYTANSNYLDMMEQCEDLIRKITRNTGFGGQIKYQGKKISLAHPWDRMSVAQAFEKFSSVSMQTALEQDRLDEIIGLEIEPNLGLEKPLFLYDYPASSGALAKLKPDNSNFAERFELYISGIELCNAFSELTDPDEQRERFEHEIRVRRLSGKKEYPMPGKFLDALHFMPEASGNALGVDRLVMLFADTAEIDDVVAFTPEDL